ncbi:tetratricopeptide repeat protein [Rubrivirga sp. S365]|uniref:Tetratricopeptide repeat protein n=1 Tax=Rubrivirga litoralis TaxID=3075598 RepID=A0ABU3BNR2_9BACT|nr:MULTISPECIES: tetratricopeptide repeat protein [unclassified Rubrivirga]MDT0630934.1 tetratricopeptide repeat protein [Rubrivirga sp. F394]MDT7856577.1 tetratricopeptide repeat protein [Rubrivirga sp. S365]
MDPALTDTDRARWLRVEALFDRALGLDGDARAALLDREAGGDAALRAEVASLLAAHDGAGAFFERAVRRIAPPDVFAPGARVGPYRVEARIGEGGMGVVYRAARADGAFERTVALKVLRFGGGDVRRFLAERQTLARLDHPGIARLYGGGLAPDGRPFFAMELAAGEPITDYAARRGLGVEARLDLFADVCAAVQYAHSRLVVHRDLKPSNVLVCDGGGAACVKLLDFGIAKALDDPDVTVAGSAPRTPTYAAPEQVAGGAVTTATDVYALGALLYELLTGRRPHAGATRADVERAVLSDAPPRPSVAVRAAPPEGAPARAAPPGAPERLARRLAGDLDQIVLKALRKEPERRYDGAAALAADVARHRSGLPVEARPATVRYRAGSFVRRHRLGVGGAAAGVLVLAAGLALAVWQGRVATAERDRAERAAAFMVGLLGEFDPNQAGAERLDAGDVLDRAVRRVEADLDGEPAVQARLYDHVGQIYQTYARYDDAGRLLRRALDARRALYGRAHREVAESLNHLAWLAFAQGDYGAADSLYAAALDVETAAEGRRTPTAAEAIEGRGLLRRAAGDPDGGVPFVREALAIREATLGAEAPEVYASVSALATLHHVAGRPAQAAPLFRRAIEGRRRALGAHILTAQSLSDYGAALADLGDVGGAAAAHREALAVRRGLLGRSHPHVAQSLSHLGWALQTQGRYADAEPLYREALAGRRAHLGPDHASVGNSLLLLGEIRLLQGDAGGLDEVADGVATLARALGPDHPTALAAERRWITNLDRAGRGGAARARAARLLPRLRRVLGPDHEKTRECERRAADVEAAPPAPSSDSV